MNPNMKRKMKLSYVSYSTARCEFGWDVPADTVTYYVSYPNREVSRNEIFSSDKKFVLIVDDVLMKILYIYGRRRRARGQGPV